MLEDRDYMRAPTFSSRPRFSLTIALLIINGVIFFAQAILHAAWPKFSIDHYFGLSLSGLSQGYLWQLLTFQFLHSGIFHLVLNCWGIYVFGPAVEQAMSRSHFLQLYLLSGVFGGVVHVLGGLVLPSHFGVIQKAGEILYVPVVGASAGLYALIAAFATLFPHQELTVLAFFVLPITVTARVLLGVSAGIAVLGLLLAGDNIAHGAHLGGMLGGYLFIRFIPRIRWPDFKTIMRSNRKRELASVPAGKPANAARLPHETGEELPPDEFISCQVDPILDKISAHGIQSLTERERKILEAARAQMAKR